MFKWSEGHCVGRPTTREGATDARKEGSPSGKGPGSSCGEKKKKENVDWKHCVERN